MNEQTKIKPTWDEYFSQILEAVKIRSTCFAPAKAALIVNSDHHIIATGYSGAPCKVSDCLYNIGQCRKRSKGFGHGEGHNECLAVHAEANAIVQAAKMGNACNNAIMYCTHKPCADCAKLIINAGIKTVKYKEEYPSELTDQLFSESGVKCETI